MRRREFIVGLAVLPVVTRAILNAKEDALQRFHAKYGSLKSMSCGFSSRIAKGTIVARKGGKYRIELDDRTIVCNGSTVYNAQKSTKTVVIDSYKPSSDEASVERIFFVMLNVYQGFVEIHDGKGIQIKLTPPTPQAMIGSVSEARVYMYNDGKYLIHGIWIEEGASSTSWDIKNLKLNTKIPESQFEFKVPKGWQSVDLR